MKRLHPYILTKQNGMPVRRYPGWIRNLALGAAVLMLPASLLRAELQDFAAVVAPLDYTGVADTPVKVESERMQSLVLLVPRTQLKGVREDLLQTLGEHYASRVQNPGMKLVTLSDLNASTTEGRNAGASKGSLLDFSNNQSVLNEAVHRGIGKVLFVDILHLNQLKSTVASESINILTVRAAATLLNTGDGVRIKGSEREIKVRGFNEGDLLDKAFSQLARDLVQVTDKWEIPAVEIRMAQVEVHAQLEGIHVPVLRVTPESGGIEVTEVPIFAEGASVEIDGVLKGSAPCKIGRSPGTHKLRVHREGTSDYVAQIQVKGGERYDALLVPDSDTRRRLNEQLALFERAKTEFMRRAAGAERAAAVTEAVKKNAEGKFQIDTAKATAIRKDAEGQLKVDSAGATAIEKGAEGKLQIEAATAKNIVAVRKAEAEAMKPWLDALRQAAPLFAAERLKMQLTAF